MINESDWRLFREQIKYLYKKELIYHKYTPKFIVNDHDHCEFCMGKFGFENDSFHYGYSTEDNYTWICEQCYKDFKNRFEWILKKDK